MVICALWVQIDVTGECDQELSVTTAIEEYRGDLTGDALDIGGNGELKQVRRQATDPSAHSLFLPGSPTQSGRSG